MKTTLIAICLAIFLAFPAAAQVLYENGPINGTVDAWTINFGFWVSDSFVVSGGDRTVTGLSFGAWLMPGDVLQSAEVSITQFPNSGPLYFDGVVNFTQSGCALNQYGFNVCLESGSFLGPGLQNGTYWLNLQNAVLNSDDPVYWDENDGVGCQSQGCPSMATDTSLGSIPSESFTLLGSTGTSTGSVPEPSSLLLMASGVLAVSSTLRRYLF